MQVAHKPDNEQARLDALYAYDLLDTPPDPEFDAITRLAKARCSVPIAVVSLVDDDRQWFKSACGLGKLTTTDRDVSFCAHAILQPELFEVPDALADPRFADNPLVLGDPFVRFYAGVSLVEPGGMALGTLCIMDRKPRTLGPAQRTALQRLAQAVVNAIVRREQNRPLELR